ncbi:MAG: HupE/UreJ family protein, partial [Phaeodactylibacter sp.]|nr:HupE/UreJ family protein [Phaeodactylibacter sp.]
MPHSILSLDVKSDKIYADLKIPLKELQFAVPFDVTEQTATLLQSERRQELDAYFLAHIQVTGADDQVWSTKIVDAQLAEAEQTATGNYQELQLLLLLQPPPGSSVRTFDLQYDAILHQVLTHRTFVTLKQDWQSGKIDTFEQQLGVIVVNTSDNTVPPLSVNLNAGSNWSGFVAMVRLGTHHIAEGVDHLLFLLVLLLPATLLPSGHRWTTFAG